MDDKEFNAKQEEVLRDLPVEFQHYVIGDAYERGHSYGYEEVLAIMWSMAAGLKPVIASYTARIKPTNGEGA